ncbi:hypothetical protein [Bacteroides sp.]
MKYREVKKIKTRSGISITNYGLFLIKEEKNKKELIQINAHDNKCKKDNFIDINEIYRLSFTKDYFIVSFKNGTTVFYTPDKRTILEIKNQLHFAFVEEDKAYIYIKNRETIYRFDKKQYKIDIFNVVKKDFLLSCLFGNNLIFRFRGDQLFLYKNSVSNIELSWQLDLNSLFPNQEDITIKSVKEYQGSLIVATSVATLRLSAEDGSVIWINNGYVRTIEIVGNTGYICTGLSLLKINLDNGEESGYGWKQNRLPDFTYKGQEYYPAGHEVVYHDGLLWYSVCSSGESFLIAINPDNGNYEWIHHVDTNDQTDAPQFYEDKMFLYDTGNTLHIYEKEK